MVLRLFSKLLHERDAGSASPLPPSQAAVSPVAGVAPDGGLADDAELISGSRFFDAAYYVAQLEPSDPRPDVPALHFLTEGWKRGFDAGPLFKTNGYLQRYPDVAAAGINPLLHFLRSGMRVGMQGWDEQTLFDWQQPLINSADLAMRELERNDSPWPRIRRNDLVGIHAHSRGHLVFRDFQRLLVQAFRNAGVDAREADENSPPADGLRIVIAPHDYFFLEGAPDLDTYDFTDCILLNSEQMQSIWFVRACSLLTRARCILDVNLQTAASLARLGLPTRFLPLGRVDGYPIFERQTELPAELKERGLPRALAAVEAPLDSRALDLVWIGSIAKRRQKFYEENAALFGRSNFFVHLVDVKGALKAEHPQAISALGYAALAQRTKIVLNVHHFPTPYFEWQRLMHFGLMQGACVVTETASRIPHLTPGEHYLEADINSIPSLVAWLLDDPEGRELAQAVRLRGYRAALEHFDLPRSLREIFSIDAVEV